MAGSSEEKFEKEKSAFDIIKNWFLNSPSHGIRRINRANSIPGRLFWSTTFLVFTTLMCIFIYTVVMKYFAYPTKINLSVRQDRGPKHFPEVTFCNLNPLRNETFLKERYPQRFPNDSCPPDLDSVCKDVFKEYMGEVLTENVINQEPIIKSGYTLEDLLINCQFNEQPCYRNLTLFVHPNYGNCYTFNKDKHVNDTGRRNDVSYFWSADDDVEDSYKLSLELFLYQEEFISYLENRAAFRIFIHREHEIPILSQNSLFLTPTTFTKLIFSERMISFSQQCRKNLTNDMKQIFNSSDVRYSQALCFKLCEFRFIGKKCNCIDPLFMVFLRFFTQNRAIQIKTNRSCSMTEACFENRNSFNSREHCPECLPECDLVQYTIQSSYADYPNLRSEETVCSHVEDHLKNIGYPPVFSNLSNCINKGILNNIVVVEISSSPYATEVLAESPMYTWVDLISSIGGQTGLWIGVSLISFVEIAELFFLLFWQFIKVIYHGILNQWKNFHQRFLIKTKTTKF